ncbi:MAG: hypothetical protein SOX28_00975, partial [Collinsella sp.]|nr:hypothetical protein [Collinsella sp.]
LFWSVVFLGRGYFEYFTVDAGIWNCLSLKVVKIAPSQKDYPGQRLGGDVHEAVAVARLLCAVLA